MIVAYERINHLRCGHTLRLTFFYPHLHKSKMAVTLGWYLHIFYQLGHGFIVEDDPMYLHAEYEENRSRDNGGLSILVSFSDFQNATLICIIYAKSHIPDEILIESSISSAYQV